MKNVKFMYHFVKPHLWRYLIGIVVLAIVDYASLFIPRITGELTDGLATHTMGMDGVFGCIQRVLIVGAIMVVGRFLWRFFLMLTARKVEYDIRNELFAHLETMDVDYYTEHKTGGLMAHFINDLNAVRMALGPAIVSTFDASIMGIMVIVQMVKTVDFRLTAWAIIPMFAIMIGELWFGTWVHKVYRRMQDTFEKLTDFVQESFSGIHVVKAFVRERDQRRAFDEKNQETRRKNLHFMKMISVEEPALNFIIGLSSFVTLFVGGKMAIRNTITLGEFVAFTQYITMLVWPMIAAGDCINMFSRGTASMARLEEIFASQSKIAKESPDNVVENDVYSLEGNISFHHLTFVHKGHLEPTIQDVNMEIKKGETIAIIGRTGTGKTTLVDLLLHLYQVPRGMIFFDGQDIRDIPLNVLRNNIAYVPQDNFLFSDTLENNIAFGIHKKNAEKVMKAAQEACIHDSIMDFPNRYETVVGERGVTLSGGQKQRSSIARALLKDAPILIMDDSLSAVDTDTEEQILENLKKNRQNKTTILIAHRITTIQNADKIMVLEEGELVECGNHSELMRLNGIYRSMFEKQQLEAQKTVMAEGGRA